MIGTEEGSYGTYKVALYKGTLVCLRYELLWTCSSKIEARLREALVLKACKLTVELLFLAGENMLH